MSVVPRSLHIKFILLFICVFAVVAQAVMIDNDVDARPLEPEILERVVVEDVELSGMTRSQAEEALYQSSHPRWGGGFPARRKTQLLDHGISLSR
jgi:hypothetical protein